VALSAMTISPQTDEVLDRLVARLEGEEGCRVIILYGSHARGDAGPDSDYDLIGFRDGERPPARETGMRDGALLDVFIYPTERLAEPSSDMLHVRGGRALRDHDGKGAAFLARLDQIFSAGPKPLSADEIKARCNWAWKMLDRAANGDVEGDFRRAFLLTMQLENFFLLRNEWYLGPKAALDLLQTEHPGVYASLKRALAPAASLTEIEALVLAVNGPRP
jgi:nucleotidyltransferase-like protein